MTTHAFHAREASPPIQPWFTYVLWGFVGSIVFSVAGLLLLKVFPASMTVFGPYYAQLVKVPTWTYMTTLPLLPVLMYAPSLGWPRMLRFVVLGCIIGGGSELIGTTGVLTVQDVALPFGAYAYTAWLGPKLSGHVPYFIPLSWFAMSLISLDLAYRLTDTRWQRVIVGSLFMVLWDVSLDPAMNAAFPFWSYAADGFYFGMPLSNWAGWFVVALLIMVSYEATGGIAAPSRWAPTVYLLNGLFPLTISLLHGMYAAVLIGSGAMAVPFVVLWLRKHRRDKPTVLTSGA